MATKNTTFYRDRRSVIVDFSAEAISSDGAVVLLEKIERKHKLLRNFSALIPDYRHPLRTVHSMEKLLKQRVYMLMQGYEDTNDVFHLQNDPLFKNILEDDLLQFALKKFGTNATLTDGTYKIATR